MRVIGHRKQILLVRYEGLITRNVRFTYSRLIWLNLSSRQNGPLCIIGRLGRGRNESARGTMGWGKRESSRLFSLLIVARALAICWDAQLEPLRRRKWQNQIWLTFVLGHAVYTYPSLGRFSVILPRHFSWQNMYPKIPIEENNTKTIPIPRLMTQP